MVELTIFDTHNEVYEDGTVLFRAKGRYDFRDNVEIYFEVYPIVKHTRCGVWISVDGIDKFVLNCARKKFAYPTKKEALNSLTLRTGRRISILERQLELSRQIADQLERMRNDDKKGKHSYKGAA